MTEAIVNKARLKLTLQYTIVIGVISLMISGVFYIRTARLIEAEFERINRRFQIEEQGIMPPPGPMLIRRRINPEDLLSARYQLIKQLILINVGIITFAGGASYWLAGSTLKPIQVVMDEQKRFVGDAAHELKTPITALKTAIEVNLMDKNIKADTKKILTENLEDVVNLENLSKQLLTLAQLDDQSIELRPTALDVTIKQAIKQVLPLARNKQIEVVDTDNVALRVKGNERALTELWTILLDNAIKYSPNKSEVKVRVLKIRHEAEVEVIDQGVGIEPEQLKLIFNRFYQTDQARTKNVANGYGLGLSIAQNIIRQHQGKIRVESQMNQGSTFLVRLPLV